MIPLNPFIMFSRLRLLLFLCLIAPLGGLLLGASTEIQDPFSQVLALEESGRLLEALNLLQNEPLRQAHKEHAANLEAVLRTSKVASLYRQNHQYERARTVLEGIVSKLDPVRDVHLVVAVYREQIAVGTQARRVADAEAEELLKKATALLDSRKYDEAVATYGQVVDRKSSEVSEELTQRARLGKIRAETDRARAQAPGFLAEIGDSVGKGIRTVLQWLIYFAGAAFLVWVLILWRRLIPARRETVIALEDLTAPAQERDARSQALTREMSLKIRALWGGGVVSVAHIDKSEDLDGAGLANLRVVVDELAKVETLIQDGTPVRIGPFSMSPRQLFSFFRVYFRRPSKFALLGSLSTQGSRTMLTVERIAQDGTSLPSDRWEAKASGDEARAEVIRDVATQIAFQLAQSKITSDWQSFRDHQTAMERLAEEERAANREECLTEARKALQSSLHHDPSNWMARFDLATVLRKIGRNEEAVEHFAFLERMMTGSVSEQSESLAEFLKQHPDFLGIVRYNKAVSLSKVNTWEAHKKAIEILKELIGAVMGSEQPRGERTTRPDGGGRQSLKRWLGYIKPIKSETTQQESGAGQPSTVMGKQQPPAEQTAHAHSETERLPGKEESFAVKRSSPESLKQPEKARLAMLSMSAWASTQVFEIEQVRHEEAQTPEDRERAHERQEQIFNQINEVREWAENLPLKTARLDWKAWTLSFAVVQNAFGRACYLRGHYGNALEAFHRAITMMPDFADPYINLAEVYMKRESKYYDWSKQAEDNLTQALVISPSNQKAHYLLGKLYADPAVAKYDDAKQHLAKAELNPWSYFQLAKILAEQDHDLRGAIQKLRRSIALSPRPDYRFEAYADYVLQLAKKGERDRQLLEEARRVAHQLKEGGETRGNRKRGAELLIEVESMLKSPT